MAKLQEKRAELKAVTDELNELEENLLSNQNEKEVILSIILISKFL
jgi:hypothetical protein